MKHKTKREEVMVKGISRCSHIQYVKRPPESCGKDYPRFDVGIRLIREG